MSRFLSSEVRTLNDLFAEQLYELHDAEHQLAGALSQFTKAATSADLRSVLSRQRTQMRKRVKRLEQIMEKSGCESSQASYPEIRNLIEEGAAIIETEKDAEARDAALACVVHRVWHLELAGYGAARTFAKWLNRDDLAALLHKTLIEEAEADEKVMHIVDQIIESRMVRA